MKKGTEKGRKQENIGEKEKGRKRKEKERKKNKDKVISQNQVLQETLSGS